MARNMQTEHNQPLYYYEDVQHYNDTELKALFAQILADRQGKQHELEDAMHNQLRRDIETTRDALFLPNHAELTALLTRVLAALGGPVGDSRPQLETPATEAKPYRGVADKSTSIFAPGIGAKIASTQCIRGHSGLLKMND